MPRWDKQKLAGLVLRGQGRARFPEDVQRELEGLVSASKLSQPHLTAEEYWNQLTGAVRSAGQSFLQVARKRMERPDDTAVALQRMLEARKVVDRLDDKGVGLPSVVEAHRVVVHSPVDPVAPKSIRLVGFSAQYSPALFVFWRDLSAFWSAGKKLDVLARRDRNQSRGSNQSRLFKQPGTGGLSLLTVSLVGLFGPRSEFTSRWLLPI